MNLFRKSTLPNAKMTFTNHCLVFVVLVISTCYESLALDSPCADWQPFKDEKCFKILDDTFRTYADAETNCAKLDDSSTLVMIHSKEEQDFLANYLFKTQKKVENFWIGAKFLTNKFHWIDNTDLTYSNWVSKGPRNVTNYCVQMQSDIDVQGQWIDEPCEKKTLVVCQRMQTWSMARLQKTLLDTRKTLSDSLDLANSKIDAQKHSLEEANNKISSQNHEIEEANKKISEQKQNLLPLGFIYTQLPNEKSPGEIFPWMTWTDVSTTYAGVFFRVNGGEAAAFGQVQAENSPRLTGVKHTEDRGYADIQITPGSWSQKVYTASWDGTQNNFRSLQFFVTDGEVRPKNMAIRLWKRTG